jgi:hypothetical protein
MVCDDKVSSIHTPEDDEQLVDYSSSPERMNLEINVVHLFVDGSVLTEEDLAHLDFGPKDAIFQKPKDTDNHLKALYMKGHINGKPISRMLVDGGAIVNLMPYSLFKKLGGTDEELIKTNMTVSGVQAPTSKKQLQRFLGKVNYLRRFICNSSGKVDAFTPLLRFKSGAEFTWGQNIKKLLMKLRVI